MTSKVSMPPVMEAVLNGFIFNGHAMNPTERQIVMFLESVGSKAWTVSGLKSLPLEWLAIRTGIPERTLKENLQRLIAAGIVTKESGSINVRKTKTTRPWATYRLSAEFRTQARAYTLTVVRAVKIGGMSGKLYDEHPSRNRIGGNPKTSALPSLQALYDRWIARRGGRA